MSSKLSLGRWAIVAVVAVVGGIALGILGLGIALDSRLAFFTVNEFNGLIGWEAQGAVGFLVAAPVGSVLSAWAVWALLVRLNAKRGA